MIKAMINMNHLYSSLCRISMLLDLTAYETMLNPRPVSFRWTKHEKSIDNHKTISWATGEGKILCTLR